MTKRELITIVDKNDNVIGQSERKTAREQGLIHRMVKVVIKNSSGQILLQQRSEKKTESPLLWDLSATGHVDAGEDYAEAAVRETAEEVGIKDIDLQWIGKYYYERSKDGLTLRRFNGILVGKSDAKPKID
ncbi:MAG TPA: NUDIX domain-containing protein, partial [Candidatus Saccharimonadia bacterium]|nr:NUDIX domain-containing protein [Candidatus Saccharimonadia bacterium]